MEDIHGIVKSRNQMFQKESKIMNRIKYFKKFPELKKDERLEFATIQSATRKPTFRNNAMILNIKYKFLKFKRESRSSKKKKNHTDIIHFNRNSILKTQWGNILQ